MEGTQFPLLHDADKDDTTLEVKCIDVCLPINKYLKHTNVFLSNVSQRLENLKTKIGGIRSWKKKYRDLHN